jgi:hypothetical protein
VKSLFLLILFIGLAAAVTVTPTKTCFNSTGTAVGNCANLNARDGSNVTIIEGAGPSWFIVNITNQSLRVPQNITLTIFGAHYNHTPRDANVSIGVWNGTDYRYFNKNLTNGNGSWTNLSLNLSNYANSSVLSVIFNHSQNGNASRNYTIDYVAVEMTVTNIITITDPINTTTFLYQSGSCTTAFTYNETQPYDAQNDSAYAYFRNSTGGYELVDTKAVNNTGRFNNLTRSGWYRINASHMFTLDSVAFTSSTNNIDIQVLGTSFCSASTAPVQSRPSDYTLLYGMGIVFLLFAALYLYERPEGVKP